MKHTPTTTPVSRRVRCLRKSIENTVIDSILHLMKKSEPGQIDRARTFQESFRILELSKACGTRSIRGGVSRIVLVAQTVHARVWIWDVRVRVRLGRVVVQAAGDRQTVGGRHQVRGAGALVIVPRLFTQLEVDDVLLDEDLIEKRLARNNFRSEPVVGALFVELGERSHLIAGAVRRLGPDQRVLVIRHVGLLEIVSPALRAQPARIPAWRKVLRFARIISRQQYRVEGRSDAKIATASRRSVELEPEIGLRSDRRERANVVPRVARDTLLGLG